MGIDLQPDLLERNRREFPDIEFVYSPIQDYRAEPFDLVTSVTVIQHNPDAEQERIVRTLRQLLRTGGHALIMENIVDRLPNVFARDPEGWRALFERAGFRQITRQTYDYRLLQRTMRRRRAASGPRLAPAPQNGSRRPGRDTLKRIIVAADSALEPALVAAHAKGATHCAFLFVAE